jgi:hypothetical protein
MLFASVLAHCWRSNTVYDDVRAASALCLLQFVLLFLCVYRCTTCMYCLQQPDFAQYPTPYSISQLAPTLGKYTATTTTTTTSAQTTYHIHRKTLICNTIEAIVIASNMIVLCSSVLQRNSCKHVRCRMQCVLALTPFVCQCVFVYTVLYRSFRCKSISIYAHV